MVDTRKGAGISNSQRKNSLPFLMEREIGYDMKLDKDRKGYKHDNI